MRNTITKTVSMMLVTVMVLGIAVMPMRAEAALTDITTLTPAGTWLMVIDFTWEIAKVMIQSTTTSEVEAAAAQFSAYFEPSLTDSFLYVTADQMNQLSKQLAQNGISVYPTGVPGRELIALALQDNTVNTATGTVTLDADVGDYYTYDGKTVVRVGVDGAAGEDFDSFTGTSSTDSTVGITPEGGLVDIPVEKKDSGETASGSTIDFDINNWKVKLENGTYTDIENFYYNPITQTYDITTIDNRHYTYQFYYDYTYITYIGSSAEYREAYKVYYELPDGRSSGDLTADELKGLSLQFDMVNYDKAASDTLTQALFPFDGDIANTSYYSVSSSFQKSVGFSFLESPDPFGGYLYCPVSNSNTYPNSFISYLETPLNSQTSYTVQGRFYLDGVFSGTNSSMQGSLGFYLIGRHPDSYWLGSNVCFRIFEIRNSQIYLTGSSSSAGSVSAGVWHDFCYSVDFALDYTRRSSFYLDGVKLSINSYSYPEIPVSTLGSTYNPSWASDQVTIYGAQVYGFGFYNGNYTCPLGVDNFRLVSAPLFSGVSSITVPQAPFDTNLVYVLPSVADLNDNTVAIMSQLPVSGYRVGGIRPTDPTLVSGYVYMHIDGEYIDSVQQWNGAYWEEVTARLYTGIRWIPVTAFNVFTLEDMFDIIDPDADGSGDNVDDIYKYYLWWSGEWGSFQQWLQGTMQTLIEAIQASGGGGGGSDAPVVIVPGYNDQTTTSEISTENPDGSTTKTTIVSNAAGLVYSNSVTTYPTDADGNTKTITVYTDSSGVMYQTETTIDRDGNVTVTEPTKATGTLGSILKMITNGVMSIAGTVIEGFVTIVVDGVKFIIESAGDLFDGIADLFTGMFGAVTDFTDSVQDYVNPPGVEPAVDGDDDEQGDGDGGQTVNIFDAFFQVLPPWLVTGLTLCFTMMIVFPLMNKIHF